MILLITAFEGFLFQILRSFVERDVSLREIQNSVNNVAAVASCDTGTGQGILSIYVSVSKCIVFKKIFNLCFVQIIKLACLRFSSFDIFLNLNNYDFSVTTLYFILFIVHRSAWRRNCTSRPGFKSANDLHEAQKLFRFSFRSSFISFNN